MTTPQIKKLLAAIPQAEHTLRFVGGCVRDGLLGNTVKDVDLATSYQPPEIMAFLKAAKVSTFPTGLEHGTVLAVVDGVPFEITTLRKDIETYGRHAKVEFTDDWLEDAKRRDFTFNALYLTPKGSLFDPWQGYEDLKAGIVRFIGDPRERIKEDYLRILRYFRFYARFSKQAPDPETVAAIKGLSKGLDRISGERIHHELFRLLEYPDPRDAFQLMVETGVLEVCLGLTHLTQKFQDLINLEQRQSLAGGVLRRFLSLFVDEPQPLHKVEYRLKLSNKEKRHLNDLYDVMTTLPISDRWVLYHYGADIFQDFILLNPPASPLTLQDKFEVLNNWHPKKLPINGTDVIKIGIAAGPDVGTILKQVEEWWIEQNFLPSKKECLTYIKLRN